MRTDLPPDADLPLDYTSTIETLKLLEGEELALFITGGPGEASGRPGGGLMASRIQAMGILRHYDYGGWAQGVAIGDGARIPLYEPDFVSARLIAHNQVDLVSLDVRGSRNSDLWWRAARSRRLRGMAVRPRFPGTTPASC